MIRRAIITLALATGLLGFTAVAAQAHDNAVTGTAVCNHDTGLIDVVWEVSNDYGLTEVLSNATRVQSQLNGHGLAKYGNASAVESVAPGSGIISLKVHGTWSDHYSRDDQSAGVQIPAVCQQIQHVTVAASFTDQTCDGKTGVYTAGTYTAAEVAGTTLTVTGDTSPGDTLTATYTADEFVVIDGAASFTHVYPTNPSASTCKAPKPKTRHAHLTVQKYPSCQRSERFVIIGTRHGIAAVSRSHGPNRQRWVIRAVTYGRFVIHAHVDGTGPMVHHIRWVIHLRHVGACGQPSPGSGRAS